MRKLLCLLLLLFASPAWAADTGCGVDTDLSESVDQACASGDEDGDGFRPDGTGRFATGTGQVNGTQNSVNTITLDAGHTFKPGVWVTIGAGQRRIRAITTTSITVEGAVVSVTDNDVLSAYAVKDCLDSPATSYMAYHIHPGVSTVQGCSAGEFRTCQIDGTFTACANISTFSCHSGGGATYFVDDDETDCNGTGAHNDEENWFCMHNTGMSGYHAFVDGDCQAFYSGTYSNGWSSNTRQMYQNANDCALAAPCTIMAVPGHSWWELGDGSGVKIDSIGTRSSNEVENVEISGSDNWTIQGLETNGATGANNAGIAINGGSLYGKAQSNYTHDTRADCGSNNCAGLKTTQDSDGTELAYNISRDNYDPSGNAVTNRNASDIVSMDVDQAFYHHNVLYSTNSNFWSAGLKFKHGVLTGIGVWAEDNIIYNKYHNGIVVGGIPHSKILRNFIDLVNQQNSGAAISTNDDSSTDDYSDLEIAYNTVRRTNCWEMIPDDTDTTIKDPFANIHHNVCEDNRGTSYPADGTDGFGRFCHYCSNAIYTATVGAGGVTIDNNCYYNTSAVALFFSMFGDSGSGSEGATYANFAAWQAAGWDANSTYENPSFDSYLRAASTNCDDKGWKLIADAAPTPTPTPPPVEPQSTGKSMRRWRAR